jgi:lipopolysaccharide/colanic/teichoic acid biosynthesis glycosyltransferase
MSESSIDRVGTTVVTAAGPAGRLGVVGYIDRGAKRALDVTLSGLLLLVCSPVILVCAVAIKAESRGPVFYGARRAGRHGRDLRVLKFRKMHNDAGGNALTGDVDPRFTRMGRWLARTKIDEIPQLWNVFRGQMSLVGPRPEDAGFVALHQSDYREILTVRPGITGLCQLAFAKEAEILDPADRVGHYVEQILPQKVKLDVYYSRTRTFGADLKILFWTVLPVFLRSDVAVNRQNGHLTVRRRRDDGVSSSSPPA